MPVKISPTDIADKWARKLTAATEDIRKGVELVDKAPSEKAVAKKDKMKANLVKAIDEGVWERRLKEYTLEDWKRDMREKALGRIPSGVEAAKGDFADFASKLVTHLNTILAEIEKMPDLTLEDSIARSAKLIREMAKFKYR
ncbi:MAG: hypothetical protein QXR81_08315 [Candidatus Nezhaarchaeales archaeon]